MESAPASPFPPAPPSPQAASKAKETKIPLVIGILCIIFGAFGIIGGLTSYMLYFNPSAAKSGLVVDLSQMDPFYTTWTRNLVIPAAVICLLQVVAGIGLVKSREWARKLAIFCALYGLAAGIFIGYLNVHYMLPFTIDQALKNNPEMKDPQVAAIARAVARGMGIAGAFSSLIFPIVTIILLMLAKVRVHCIAASSKALNLIAGS